MRPTLDQASTQATFSPADPVRVSVAVGALSVSRVTLTDFRSYAHLRLEVGTEPVVLCGANGAGKTNLLEAVSFLAPGRGLRGIRLTDAGRIVDGSFRPWAVAAGLRTPEGQVDVGTGLTAQGATGTAERRRVRIDGENVRGQAELSRVFAALWLTPQMDRLFLEGPSGRRRFLDRLVFAADPAHAGRVGAFEQAMRERLRLLKSGSADRAWLSALESTMAERGVAVAAARLDVAERLGEWCLRSEGPFPRAGLHVAGRVEDWLRTRPALEAEERLRRAWEADRASDGESGATQTGPHRSDLEVTHLAKMQPASLCSTGEQKSLLLAIVLANARMQAAERGVAPVLLLDEVAAHLDAMRREALFDVVDSLGVQAWMTGTDLSTFAPLKGRAQFFTIEDAAVTAA